MKDAMGAVPDMAVSAWAYRVPAGYGEASFVEKRSRFTGRVWPCADEAEALARIAEMRKQFRDATHNVYAYVIKDGPVRFNDDGEPQGTSGMPVLNVFRSEGVFSVCCVVTRYYGGILLGAGGLVRAYSKAAKAALDAAGVLLMRQWDVVLIPCPYPLLERMKSLVASCGGIIESSEFGTDVLIQALVPTESSAGCLQRVADLSSGAVEAVVLDTAFRGARTG